MAFIGFIGLVQYPLALLEAFEEFPIRCDFAK
jgi:hypothetical protein